MGRVAYRGMSQPACAAFYVHGDPPPDADAELALRWLAQQGGKGLVVAPTQNHFRQGFLRQAARQFQTETARTVGGMRWPGGPAAAFWPNAATLDRLDEDRRVTALCVVPWRLAEIREWISARAAAPLGHGAPSLTPSPPLDPVVLEALVSLTRLVNLSTGLGHPSDHAAAVGAFQALRRGGYDFSAEAIRPWLMQNGWRADDARDVGAVAEKVRAGHRFQFRRGIEPPWRPNILDIWREEAAKREGG